MIYVYQLIGTNMSGGEDWEFKPIFDTYDAAEKQRQIEIRAYTMVNGVKMFECPYDFEIIRMRVQG